MNDDTETLVKIGGSRDEEWLHEEKRWRDELNHRRSTMVDAEDVCIFLVDDLLTAIFQEMQVKVENASLFATSAQQMCSQVFESVHMSSFLAADSLHRISGPTKHELKERQQILKPSASFQSQTRPFKTSASVSSRSSPVLFLKRLLKFLEEQSDRAELELLRFPTSRAISSKRKVEANGFRGEWCISVDQISTFLLQIVSKGLVSAVPSTIAFVMAVNRQVLDQKKRVRLVHLQQFVQIALLTAEEEKLLIDRDFSVQGVVKPEIGPAQELLSSYLEELPPKAVEMDHRAPGQVGKKAGLSTANASHRAISRKVMLLLAPPPRHDSRWTTVRHKVIIPTANDTKSTLIAEEMPDTAAFSNIFSLGTPRQLSTQELARRNDLLAQLERETAKVHRRSSTEYTATNSIVTTGAEGCSRSLSPTRPEARNRANGTRSKFELERDPLPFTVSDGNSHVLEDSDRLTAVKCSPIKRPRPIAPSSPLETSGRPIQTPSTLSPLPQLDSSRLAIGVSVIVKGIEKRGPQRCPSRNSRLQLHNYSPVFEGLRDEVSGVQVPFSPVRTSVEESRDYRLPLIPTMSPIKASPHRKHVAFKTLKESEKEASISPKTHVRQRPSPKPKQPVWEAQTRSPPRERNHFFANGKNCRKFQRYEEEEEVGRQQEEAPEMFREPIASRRNELLTSEFDEN